MPVYVRQTERCYCLTVSVFASGDWTWCPALEVGTVTGVWGSPPSLLPLCLCPDRSIGNTHFPLILYCITHHVWAKDSLPASQTPVLSFEFMWIIVSSLQVCPVTNGFQQACVSAQHGRLNTELLRKSPGPVKRKRVHGFAYKSSICFLKGQFTLKWKLTFAQPHVIPNRYLTCWGT